MKEKQQKLSELAIHLKSKFHGLDEQIDKIIKAISAWYIDPSLIEKPVIINLWGMTGTGKTQLVREIVHFLFGKYDSFFETDCRNKFDLFSKIHNLVKERDVDNNPPIFLFDEIQFAKTIDKRGEEVHQPQQEIWSLFNDGSLIKYESDKDLSSKESIALEEIFNLEEGFIDNTSSFYKNLSKIVPEEALTYCINKFNQDPKKNKLDLYERIKVRFKKGREVQVKTVVSKALIFTAGNIDSAFHSVEEVDSDMLSADELYEKNKSVSLVDIKTHLLKLFRAEQVARLGNCHIIFYGINESSYRNIITNLVDKSLDKIMEKTGHRPNVSQSFIDFIYQNGVIPSQGIRNLLSFYSCEIQPLIPTICFWIKEHEMSAVELGAYQNKITMLGVSKDLKLLSKEEIVESVFLEDDLHKNKEFQKLVAIHEAGHAVVWWALTKTAPELIRSKSAHSSSGGYVKLPSLRYWTKKDFKNRIATALGGMVAEKRFGGEDSVSAGSSGDLISATRVASRMVRELSMGSHLSRSTVGFDDYTTKSFNREDDLLIESILKEAETQAFVVLEQNQSLYDRLVEILKVKNKVSREEFLALTKEIEIQPKSEEVQVWNLSEEQTFKKED